MADSDVRGGALIAWSYYVNMQGVAKKAVPAFRRVLPLSIFYYSALSWEEKDEEEEGEG